MRSFYRANYKGPDEATKAAHSEHTVDISRNQKKGNSVERTDEEEESLETLINQLNAMVGLEKVKGTVNQLIHFNTIRQIRDERGLAQMPMTQHMVFYGNPGTGKTTIARMIAKIYHHLGLLSKGHLVEVDRSGLVAGYVGHTALKVKDVVKQAKGGVLLIDEAYALTYKRSENDFGWEAVDTLIKAMEDEREDLVVIVAGYETTEDALEYAEEFFEEKALNKGEQTTIGFNASLQKKQPIEKGANFSNARMVRNFLEIAVMNQTDRLYDEQPLTDEELCTIEYDDVKSIA